MLVLRLLTESFLMAFGAMAANRLRTFLSLLGITIGILAIISVFTVVDGMKDYVRNSIKSLYLNGNGYVLTATRLLIG